MIHYQVTTSRTAGVTQVLCCSGSVELLQLNPVTGNIMDQTAYHAPRGSRLQSVALHQDSIVALTSDGHKLCIANLLGRFRLAPLGTKPWSAVVTLTSAQAYERTGLRFSCKGEPLLRRFPMQRVAQRELVMLVAVLWPVKLLHPVGTAKREGARGGGKLSEVNMACVCCASNELPTSDSALLTYRVFLAALYNPKCAHAYFGVLLTMLKR